MIELGHRQPLQAGGPGFVQHQQGLGQREGSAIRLGMDRVRDALPGDLLIRVRLFDGLVRAAQHLAERRLPGEVGAQRDEVGEEPDHPLRFGEGATGDVGRDHHLRLPREAVQPDVHQRERRGERGYACLGGQLTQDAGVFRVQPQRKLPHVRVEGLGPTGRIGGEIDDGRRARQELLPVLQLPLEAIEISRLTLVKGEVGVLQRRGRQQRPIAAVPSPTKGGVELRQEGLGPDPVDHQVAQGDREDVAMTARVETEELEPVQGAAREIQMFVRRGGRGGHAPPRAPARSRGVRGPRSRAVGGAPTGSGRRPHHPQRGRWSGASRCARPLRPAHLRDAGGPAPLRAGGPQ